MSYDYYLSNYKKKKKNTFFTYKADPIKPKTRVRILTFKNLYKLIRKIIFPPKKREKNNPFIKNELSVLNFSYSAKSHLRPLPSLKVNKPNHSSRISLAKSSWNFLCVLLRRVISLLRSTKVTSTVKEDLPITNKSNSQGENHELKVSPSRKSNSLLFGYYFGFFLLLALLPIFYFNNEDKSFFISWVEAHGLPQVHNQESQDVISSFNMDNSTNRMVNSKLPQVILLKETSKRNGNNPSFQAGINRGLFWRTGNQSHDEVNVTLGSKNGNNKELILNYESTNEVISEDDIGDWVDENEQGVFKDANPFTTMKEDMKKKVFDHRYYRVMSGDSLWSISKKFNVSIDSLISLNKIKSPHGLAANSQIMIPRMSGIYYQVKKSDSLFNIAKSYKVKLERIREYNELGGYLQVGKTIFIPGAKYNHFEKDYIFGNLFISPVNGTLSSKYGLRVHPIKRARLFHTGIDIAKNNGERVRVAADGVVVMADFNGGYGKYVKVKHSMGYETAYAHLSAVWVKLGQKVKKGQYIGRVGNTGISTGPHLHFEVKHKGKFVNPLRFVKL